MTDEVQTATADEHYLTGTLRSFSIQDVRRGPKVFYGAVHSFASLGHFGGRAEFTALAAPAKLKGVDARHLEDVVVLDQPIFGPVPYRGGNLSLEIGVLAVEARDLTGPLVDLLEVLALAAGVSFVDVARPFVRPMVSGIAALTGLDGDSALELGLSKSFDPPASGDYVVVKAPRGSAQTDGWRLTANGLVRDDGQVVREPHISFSLRVARERADWYEIPSLKAAHETVREAVRSGRLDRAKEAVAVFRLTALTSEDLLLTDARRLCDKLETLVREALPAGLTAGNGQDVGDLRAIQLYS
jgi:hypothetical protein